MNKIKLSIIISICICIVISGTSCDSSKEELKNDELIISESAVKYEFPSDNFIKYKGIIIEEDYIVYVFGRFSEFTKALKEKDDMKIFTEYYDESKRKYTTEWKIVEDTDSSYLIIYCNSENYDFNAGIMISNYINEDGENIDGSKSTMIEYSIMHLQNPRIIFRNLADKEKKQYYKDGKWSDVSEKSYTQLD